jgi:hypothetical protein
VLPNQAFLLAALVTVPAVMYVLYVSIAPYEAALRDMKLAAAMMWPGVLGFAIGVAHLGLDPGLVESGTDVLAFLLIYPLVDTFAVVVVFNRPFFYKQASLPVYFAVGGASLSTGIAFVESFRTFAAPGVELLDAVRLAAMLGLATALVAFHSARALFLGTQFAEGVRTKALVVAVAMEAPVGLLVLAGLLNVAAYESLALLLAYSGVVYYLVWHVHFPKHLPEEMRRALDRERKKVRRRGLGRT